MGAKLEKMLAEDVFDGLEKSQVSEKAFFGGFFVIPTSDKCVKGVLRRRVEASSFFWTTFQSKRVKEEKGAV